VGVAQLKKLPDFLAARQRNFDRLYERLSELEEFFVLPRATRHAAPSWFGFPLAVRPGAPFTRNQLIGHLERRKVATRLLFGGNLTRQPAYRGANYRAVGSLANADFAMNQAFWVGIYPGLSDEAIDYTGDVFYALARNPDL